MRYSVEKALIQMPEDWDMNKLIFFVKHCVSLVRSDLVVFINTKESLLSATLNLYSAIQNDVHPFINVVVFPPEAEMDHFEDHVLLLSPDHSRVETKHSVLVSEFELISQDFHFRSAEIQARFYARVLIAGTWDHLHL